MYRVDSQSGPEKDARSQNNDWKFRVKTGACSVFVCQTPFDSLSFQVTMSRDSCMNLITHVLAKFLFSDDNFMQFGSCAASVLTD